MFDHDAGIVAPQVEHDLPRQRIALALVPKVAGQIIFQALARVGLILIRKSAPA